MTVPMDSSLDFSSRERVQHLYEKNVELENRRRRAAQARIPSDPNAWQQMRENYEAIILEDHAFSEQHEIEYALWQLHYRRIEELRAHFSAAVASNDATTTQSGKGSARPDRITKIRSQFKTFLSEATGFYHDLMLKIRSKYGLPLDYFSDYTANQNVISTDGNKSAEMKKCLISCHRCLIYLGDLSRYKGLYGEGDSKEGDFAAASSYYIQASSLLPSSGNPHHQLAILASYSGDELVTIYRYFRSLAVDNPFSTARDNLIIAFEKNRLGFSKILGDSKASSNKMAPVRTTRKGRGKGGAVPPLKDSKTVASSVKERASCISETFRTFSIRFVRLNGILFTRTSLETFGEVFSMVRGEFLELLSSVLEEQYNFGSGATENGLVIIRIVSILIFTVHNVNRENENQSYAEILQRSVLLQNAFTAIFELMGLIVERCVQLHDPLASFLLPGVLVFVEWLACHPDMLAGSEVEEKQATARSFFWNNCVSFLNRLLSSVFTSINEDEDESCFFNMSRYDEGETANRLALWEDFELRGFLPLVPAQQILDFSGKQSFGSDGGNKEKEARAQRIIAAGKAIVNLVQVGQHSIYFDSKLKIFTIGVEPQPSNDFVLTSSMEMPASNGTRQEWPVEENVNLGVLQPNTQLYTEGEEEEDEVIVFKPSVTDKHADATSSKLVSYEAVRPDSIPSTGDFGYCGSVSTSVDGILLQNGFDTKLRPPTSLATIVPQHLQSIQASNSKWLMEQQDSLASRLNDLSFMEILPPDALSLPLPQSVNLNAGNEFYGQVSDPVIPSKFDTIMSPGASFDNLTVKTSSALSSRKNPVSRPVRCLGPPPGFSPVLPKLADQSLSRNTLKDENLQMDDYSWLDGYQFPSSTKGMGFNNSINHSAETYYHVSTNNGFTGKINSPFLRNQVPTLPGQMENKKIWQDYLFPDHQKEFQNQQQQFQRINQQSFPLPEHHPGQSLWEGRFFV